MTIRRLLVLAVAVFLIVGITVAQGPKKDVGKDVPLPPALEKKAPTKTADQLPQTSLSIDVDLVNFDVVVTDQSGNPIGGLEKQHFRVFDDDVEQTVTNFSSTESHLTVVIFT